MRQQQLRIDNIKELIKKEVMVVEIKNIKTSKLGNDELLDIQKQVENFLKFLNGEYETVKKLEEENS